MSTWGVSSWSVVVRCLQILGILVSAILNGFLLVYIHIKRLGLSSAMLSLEIMVSNRSAALCTPDRTILDPPIRLHLG